MSATPRAQRRLALVTLLGSGTLVVGLFAAYLFFGSQLALAQAADSFLDVFTAAVLTYAIGVAAQPEDAEHPLGHSRAEPLGALVTAVIAGVLAVEVARSAVTALLLGAEPHLDAPLLLAFAAKIAFKGGVLLAARALGRHNPAVAALAVDARNDILLSAVAVLGYLAARAGAPRIDAWLALPVAAWIGLAGVRLARDNLRLLMGVAPALERQRQLTDLARAVPGVRGARPVVAQHLGTVLDVRVEVIVDGALTVRQGHDIGEAVRARLLAQPDVGHCSVHVNVE